MEGQEIVQLHGHESFIYSLATLPSGEIVSVGEDRTARIWEGATCVQTITHPAISVWSVAVCAKSGDLVTGASDNIARVFSRDSSRLADPAVIAKFDESVRASAIPREQVGEIKETDLPGPDFLQTKSGTKEGQVQVIKEADGSKGAYQWSTATQSWISVGTVVDSVGSGGPKKTLNGIEYDFVFDVDIEDDKPPLKLGYNVNQNPYQAAEKFLVDNELPGSYLQQTADFIMQQTQGTTFGQSAATQPAGADPWGQESRYRPGEQFATPSQVRQPGKLPQKDYLPIAVGKVSAAYNRIKDLGQKYKDEGSDQALTDTDLKTLDQLFQQLSTHNFDGKGILRSTSSLKASIPLLFRIATKWEPIVNRLAPLDMLRFLAAGSPEVVQQTSTTSTTIPHLLSSGVFAPSTLQQNPKLAMITIRLLSNLLCSESGRHAIEASAAFDLTLEKIRTTTATINVDSDSALAIAVATFLLNASVALTDRSRPRPQGAKGAPDADVPGRALVVLEEVITLLKSLKSTGNAEACYRALFAVGTLLAGLEKEKGGEEVRQAVGIYDLGAIMGQLKERGLLGEGRFEGLVREVEGLL